MTTVTHPLHGNRPPPKRWTAAEFDNLVALGVFDGQRVELINGELLEMADMNDAHAQVVQLMQYALLTLFPPTTHTVRVQLPMRLPSGSRPVPDVVVVHGTPRQVASHPESAALVVEVADSTLDFDRSEKAALYAENRIPEYWIVNLPNRCIEVHRRPLRRGGDWIYEDIHIARESDSVEPIAFPGGLTRVADVLP